MSNLPVLAGGAHLPAVTDDGFLEEVRTQLAPKASDSELRYFAQVVAKTQLDPWSRQVYLIPRWDGRVKREVHRPQVSIDGLRLIAERSGKYDGQTPVEWCGDDGAWRDTWFEGEAPRAARVGVYKAGRPHPTYAVAHYDEYVVLKKDGKPSGLWADKPRVMLAKCAEALALRKGFPQETSGLYTAEEMGRADVEAPKPRDNARSVPEIEAEVVTAEPVSGTITAEQVAEIRGLVSTAGWDADQLRWGLLALDVEDPQDLKSAMASLSVPQFEQLKAALASAIEGSA